MSLSDWAVCPESSCKATTETITLDTVDHGEGHVFISFHCEECESGSLDDDFRWWVRCPDCMEYQDIPVDEVEYEITDDGKINFECTECGCSVEQFPESRWSSN